MLNLVYISVKENVGRLGNSTKSEDIVSSSALESGPNSELLLVYEMN